ncbi:hypothetical protein [Hoeflea marina]|uniref:hypothetical protein n=1 Tax=Hoeflea marina TaxID=274592 RepID=UPI0011B7590C|nr:hypothetical protein [Hoeflea marina]
MSRRAPALPARSASIRDGGGSKKRAPDRVQGTDPSLAAWLVDAAGSYRFADFLKIGLVMNVIVGIASCLAIRAFTGI